MTYQSFKAKEPHIHAFSPYILKELEKALIEYGEGIKVLAPKALVSRIRKRLLEAAKQYE